MPRALTDIISDMDSLSKRDFDHLDHDSGGWKLLDGLCDELCELGFSPDAAQAMYRTMERLDSVDLGMPGSLVHTLEKWNVQYEGMLFASVRRKPSQLGTLMINRILNTDPPDAPKWHSLLRGVLDHPDASENTRSLAARFLQHQESRGRR
jgi:hypothetical protein